jgi:hypothetical protein
MPKNKKKRNALKVRSVENILYLAEPKGLIRNPDIFEKVGALRRPRHHHLGAVIALPVAHAKLNITVLVNRHLTDGTAACLRAQ